MSSIEKIYQMGETIIKEGRFSNSFYIIKEGMVEVVKQKGDREVQLSLLGPNEFFGEMSLLDPEVQKHDATIRAVEETTVIIMDKEDFAKYIGQMTPGTRSLLLKMARRLREADQKITGKEGDAQDSSDKRKSEKPDNPVEH